MHEAGVLSAGLAPLERPPKRVVARQCCRGAYLRGALLGSGSLSGPRMRHLEIRRSGREGAEFLAALAPFRVVDRGRHAAAYAKGAEAIAGILAAAGASDAVLRFEERAVMGTTRARANRLANADHANLVRTGKAAHRQLRALRRLQKQGVLEGLPEPLHEAAALRLRNPSLSLRELGRRCRPPASKAAMHRRLTALERMAS
jgi:hypothetical protein